MSGNQKQQGVSRNNCGLSRVLNLLLKTSETSEHKVQIYVPGIANDIDHYQLWFSKRNLSMVKIREKS